MDPMGEAMNGESELEEKTQQTTAVVLEASMIAVTAETYERAAELRRLCKDAMEYFEGLFRPRISEADKLHSNLLADLKRLKAPPETQWKRIGFLLSDFDCRVQQEKERLEREAERKRREQEAEQQRLADLAAELGSIETQEDIKASPVDPGPIIKKEVPEVEGLHYRHGGYGFTVVNEDLIGDEYWMLDQQKMQGIVSRLGKQAEKVIGGIEVFEKPRIPVQPRR